MPTKVKHICYICETEWIGSIDCPECGTTDTLGYEKAMDKLNRCPECNKELPASIKENRGEGYSEAVTYCPCGATFTGGI